MKETNANSYASPQVLTAEILMSKFGQHYQDKLVPAITEGFDRLDDSSWFTLQMYYLSPEDDRSIEDLAEQLNCSIPDAQYALDEAMKKLQLHVQRDAKLDVSLEYLDKLLAFIQEEKMPQPVAVAPESVIQRRSLKEVFLGVLDLKTVHSFMSSNLIENVVYINFVKLSEEEQQLEHREREDERHRNVKVLPDGPDIKMNLFDRQIKESIWIRITEFFQVYLVYEGKTSYRGVQLGGNDSTLPWMFFDFQSEKSQPDRYWLRLGFIDKQAKIVLESRSRRVVLHEDISQIPMQFLTY